MKIVFVLNAETKFSFSRLRHQFYVISGLALKTIFKHYRVAFYRPIFPQYTGIRLLPLHKIWTLLKTVNANITSNEDNYDFKIYILLVKQLGIRTNLGIFTNEPAHEIMAFFVLRKLILQMRMRSHPVGLGVWFLVRPFVYFHTSCVRTAKALARLRGCAGSPEPSLVAYVISTIISWTSLNIFWTQDE